MTLAQELADALGCPLDEAEREVEDAEQAGIIPVSLPAEDESVPEDCGCYACELRNKQYRSVH